MAEDTFVLGQDEGYRKIIDMLQVLQKMDEIAQVQTLFSLSQCVSLLRPGDFDSLVHVLLTFDLDLGLHATREQFKHLLADIACSNPGHIPVIIDFLVSNLFPRVNRTRLSSDGSIGDQLQTDHQRFSHVHQILKVLIAIAPSTAGLLFSALSEKFPHKSVNIVHQRFFLQNVLMLSRYVSSLRHDIIALCIHRLIQVDVEIKIDDDPQQPQHTQSKHNQARSIVEEGLFELELDENNQQLRHNPKQQQMQQQTDREEPEATAVDPTINLEMAEKLDIMMDVMFEYFQSFREAISTPGTAVPVSQASAAGHECDDLFQCMIRSFSQTILNTHKCKYTQFLVFFLCSFSKDYFYSNFFIRFLMERLFDFKQPDITRLSCSAYLASFLARARFIDSATLRFSLTQLTEWLHEYIKHFESQVHQVDVDLHSIFYSICHTVVYIICFRNADLVPADAKASTEFMRTLDLPHILSSRFNPFKVINWETVVEFSHIFRKSGLFDFRELIRANRNIVIPTVTQFGSPNKLDFDFWPFDPYLLRNTAHYIEPLYQVWHNRYREDDDHYFSDLEQQDDDDEDDDSLVSDGGEEDGLASSFNNTHSSSFTQESNSICSSSSNDDELSQPERMSIGSPPFLESAVTAVSAVAAVQRLSSRPPMLGAA